MQNKILFTTEATKSETLTLVLFRTEWNGSCQIVSMIYERLAKTYHGKLTFFTVDFEKEPALSREFGIVEVPTILFFKNGILVDHSVGLTSKEALISKIESAQNSINKPSIHNN
jgi:thioredoxin 1